MALIPKDRYPLQIDTTDPTGYPHGKAQNIVVTGDGSGTPWEKDLVDDIFGFQQALLDAASITPSGTPDKVGASQYQEALEKLFIDGLRGGTYSPSALIIIDGANGFRMDAPTLFNGAATFDGTATFNDAATFNAGITLTDIAQLTLGAIIGTILTVGAPATFQDSATFDDAAVFNHTANFKGDTTFEHTVVFEDSSTFQAPSTHDADAVFNQAVTLAGTTSVQGPMTMTNAGHIRYRHVELANADVTRGINDGDNFLMKNLAPTAQRTITLSHTDAAVGDRILVTNWDTTHLLNVADEVGGTFEAVRNSSGAFLWVLVTFDGTEWITIQRGGGTVT